MVSMRVAELTIETTKRIQDGIVGRRVTDINHRVKEWQERWEAVRNAIDLIEGERGEEMAELQGGAEPGVEGDTGVEPHYIAGGSSGFIVKDLKGKEADKPVYRVDGGLVQLYNLELAIAKRVAVELGQWTGKRRLAEDEDVVCPDLDKLTDEENVIFERLFNKAVPTPKGSIQ